MTVRYASTIATVQNVSMVKLLLRWRGSVYKAVWPMVLIFFIAYGTIALTYYCLPSTTLEQQLVKLDFVKMCIYAGKISNSLPMLFILSMFVSMVMGRWWDQFCNLPTPDRVWTLLNAYLTEPKVSVDVRIECVKREKDRCTLFRRAIVRYLNLAFALLFQNISLSMKRRLGSLDDLVQGGLMTQNEQELFIRLSRNRGLFIIPLVWAALLIAKAHEEGIFLHETYYVSLMNELTNYWRNLQTLSLYDYTNIPLVYNQLIHLNEFGYTFAEPIIGQLLLRKRYVDNVSIGYETNMAIMDFVQSPNSLHFAPRFIEYEEADNTFQFLDVALMTIRDGSLEN
ncbi:Bestrophin, partial [Opisthorchis viverrini]